MLTLYQFEISPFCDKIRRVLNWKRQPYEIREVSIQESQLRLGKLSPAGKLPCLEHDGRMVREKGYIVDLCTDKALAFIERKKAGPFLCYVPFTTPHSPWRAPDDDWARWKDKPIAQRGAAKEDVDETRCALAMVEGLLEAIDAELGVAVTGIAGPDGGTGDKPVGTVWIAWKRRGEAATARCHRFDGDRMQVRLRTVETALAGLAALST